jgi:hypothetical protein
MILNCMPLSRMQQGADRDPLGKSKSQRHVRAAVNLHKLSEGCLSNTESSLSLSEAQPCIAMSTVLTNDIFTFYCM